MPTLSLNDAGCVRLFNWLQARKHVGGPYWRMLRRLDTALGLDGINDRIDAAQREARGRLRACATAFNAAEAGSDDRYEAEEALLDAKRDIDRGVDFMRPSAPPRPHAIDAADAEMLQGLLKDVREKERDVPAEAGTAGEDWRVFLPIIEAVERANEKPAEKQERKTAERAERRAARNGAEAAKAE